jgi:hypothetical protein
VAQPGDLGPDLALRGLDVQPRRAQAGDLLEVTLDAQVLQPPHGSAPTVVITGPDGQTLDTSHEPVAGKLALEHWPTGRFVRDRFLVQIPRDAQPGSYQAQVQRGSHVAGTVRVEILR